MDNRPVRIRTDASAEDFWKRVRKSEDVSPVNFHILTHAERIQRSTPYGRQQRPHLPATVASALRTSRSVERVELRAAIREGEDDKENLERAVREKGHVEEDIRTRPAYWTDECARVLQGRVSQQASVNGEEVLQ